MGYQQKLARKVAKYQRKVSDFHVDQLGTEQDLVRLEIIENKYKDQEITLISNSTITGIISWPDNEIPLTFETNNTGTSQGLHLYDILPIIGCFKWETKVNYGDILLQKIRVNPDLETTDSTGFRLLALQVVDLVAKASVELVSKKYGLAPYTLNVDQVDGLQDIIDDYLNESWED